MNNIVGRKLRSSIRALNEHFVGVFTNPVPFITVNDERVSCFHVVGFVEHHLMGVGKLPETRHESDEAGDCGGDPAPQPDLGGEC